MLYSSSCGSSALLSAKIIFKLKDVPPASREGSKTPKSPYSKRGLVLENGSIFIYCLDSSGVVFHEISSKSSNYGSAGYPRSMLDFIPASTSILSLNSSIIGA